MQTGEFIAAFREAFGPVPELPLLFRYTDEPLRPVEKVGGCFFKVLAQARGGQPVGLNAANIGCGGGKFYTGFSPMPEFVPQLVSLRERYKQTPEMVLEFIAALDLRPAPKAWIEFVEALITIAKRKMNARATDLYIEQLLNAAAPGRHRISMVKDVRIFVNTIDHAIRLMTDNGVPATAHREERDGYIEYTVRIPTAAAQR